MPDSTVTAELPLCVVGGGNIGARHATVALTAKGVRLTAVAEPDETRRNDLRQQGLPVVASLADVPPETAAAVIATPTPDHCQSGLTALENGWAVLVEKPVTQTLEDSERLCRASEQAGLALFTGHHRRSHPSTALMRDQLPEIGRLVAVQGLWSLRKHDSYYDVKWRREKGAGPILTNLSHELDLLRLMAGEIEEITALTSSATRKLEIEDTCAMTIRFASGALGTFLISDAGASPWAFEAATGENPGIAWTGQDSVRFIGTQGALSFPSLTRWGAGEPGEIEWSKPLQKTPGPTLTCVDPIEVQLERFARAMNGQNEPLLATGRDGQATLAATVATIRAAETGQPVGPKSLLNFQGVQT